MTRQKPQSPPAVTNPLWVQSPDPFKIQNAFPAAATKQGATTGVGYIHCALRHDGGLTQCSIAQEQPAGLGFGPAALALAETMSINPWTSDGHPVDGAEITVPIRLNAASDQAAEPPARDYQIIPFDARWRCDGTLGPYTPDRALRYGLRAGIAVIDCAVNVDGSLYACTLVADAPPDFGFGDAALIMARRRALTTAPIIENGKPVSGRVVRLTIKSQLGGCPR